MMERPRCEKAHAFQTYFCEDPNCGLHIVPTRVDGTPICEMVMSAEHTLAFLNHTKDILYAKTVEKDDG